VKQHSAAIDEHLSYLPNSLEILTHQC